MIRRTACLLAALAAAPAWSEGAEDAAARCAEGLDRSLEVMEAAPLLKEEVATGLMWLRLDARLALEAGDTATCLDKLDAVETILGLPEPVGD